MTPTAESIVRRFERPLRGYLIVLGCPVATVDDLVQDTFLSFLSADFEHRSETATSAYLRRIARNLFLKSLGHERRQRVLVEIAASERAWIAFEENQDDGGDSYLQALRECLTRVKERAELVLRLRYEGRLSRVDIARRLGLKESGVKSILVRTKKLLRACIEERLVG